MAVQSWGIELWDQTDNLLKYSNDGINQLDHVYQCVSELGKLHAKHGTKHKQLQQKYNLKLRGANRDVDECSFTESFSDFVNMIGEVGTLHETFAAQLKQNIANELKNLHDDLRKRCAKQKTDNDRINQVYKKNRDSLEKAFNNYKQAHREMQRARESYKKVEEDKSMSRADVDKQKSNCDSKTKEYDRLKAEYATELENFNKYQKTFYQKIVPDWAAECEIMDSQRLSRTKQLLEELSKLELETTQKLIEHNRHIETIASKISVEKDSKLVVQSFRTGKPYPGDELFHDLEKDPLDNNQSTRGSTDNLISSFARGSNIQGSKRFLNKFFKPNKQSSSELTPKQLEERLNETRQSISNTEKEIESMIKMRDAYKANPAMGDYTTFESRIETSQRQLLSLKEKLESYENGSNETKSKGRVSCSMKRNTINKLFRPRSIPSLNDKKQVNGSSKKQPNHTPNKDSMMDDSDFDEDIDPPGNHDDEREPPIGSDFVKTIVGACTALYDFKSEHDDEDYLAMKANDQFYVLDTDGGSGWTYVETISGEHQGFVPTSYLHIQMYDSIQ